MHKTYGERMQVYDIKRGYTCDLSDVLARLFDDVKRDGERFVVKFGAAQMAVREDANKLHVETEMRKDIDAGIAASTLQTYNRFLELATGYTAKERVKRLRARAKKG